MNTSEEGLEMDFEAAKRGDFLITSARPCQSCIHPQVGSELWGGSFEKVGCGLVFLLFVELCLLDCHETSYSMFFWLLVFVNF